VLALRSLCAGHTKRVVPTYPGADLTSPISPSTARCAASREARCFDPDHLHRHSRTKDSFNGGGGADGAGAAEVTSSGCPGTTASPAAASASSCSDGTWLHDGWCLRASGLLTYVNNEPRREMAAQ